MPSLMIAGTPAFMSPEQADGRAIDCRSDLFSLGSVLYTLCAGKRPFGGDTSEAVLKRICKETPHPLREINPATPVWLEVIITRLLAKRPEDRYSSAAEVVEVLGRCLAHLQAGEEPAHDSALLRGNRSSSPRRVFLRSGAVVLCIGLGWAISSVVWDRESPTKTSNPDVQSPSLHFSPRYFWAS